MYRIFCECGKNFFILNEDGDPQHEYHLHTCQRMQNDYTQGQGYLTPMYSHFILP